MDAAQWQTFASQFPQLSHRQRLASSELLRTSAPQAAAVVLIEQTALAQLHCPSCRSTHFHRHGQAHGLQRYRCVPCRKTFNALSGTPLAHLHHKECWLAYADCLLNSFSVRMAASKVHIHRNTSFRWRHRFLALAKTDRPRCLHGITEADEMYVLESQKGSKHMTRPARQRGGRASQRGISNEQVCVLVARDRTGQTVDFVTGMGQLTKAKLHACLPPVIDRDILLVSDGHPAYPVFARELGIEHAGRHPRAWHGTCTERQCLSQPVARLAACVSWRGHALPAQLPGLALDTRCKENIVPRKLAQGQCGHVPTFDGDIAFIS